MQLFCSIIFIICIFECFECSLYDQVSRPNGDELIRLNDSGAVLEILFNLPEVTKKPDKNVSDAQLRSEFPDNTQLTVTKWTDACIVINYSSNYESNLIASVNVFDAHMYGGVEDDEGNWPLRSSYHWFENFVSKTAFDAGVLEPYWLLSNGYYIYVDNRVPLFLDSQDSGKIFKLNAKKGSPYIKHEKPALNLAICKLRDVLHAQQHAIQHFLGKPSKLPDKKLVTHPVWSTDGKFGNNIDQEKILLFAQDIAKHDLAGQLRIDKTWQECSGSLKPHKNFTTFKNLISELKKLNFTVALAIDAFVGYNCSDTYDDGIKNNYFVKNDKGSTSVNGAEKDDRFIDLTNPNARNWFLKRLQHLRETYGIDSFKLDNVFSSSPPQPPVYHTVSEDHPETIVKESAKLLASLGSDVQTSVARNTQQYGFLVRMIPRSSSWNRPPENNNKNAGLKSIIPTLLQFSTLGYSFIVPDKIGGGDEYSKIIENTDLYIRWTQLNVFMPFMEFAVPPWEFNDTQVFSIAKKCMDLRAQYTPLIVDLMKEHVKTGAPVNRPLWWIAPRDDEALKCDSEFLLGEKILVAPVIDEGQKKRDIYLPPGQWKDGNNEKIYNGSVWLREYSAELHILPYFLNMVPNPSPSTTIDVTKMTN